MEGFLPDTEPAGSDPRSRPAIPAPSAVPCLHPEWGAAGRGTALRRLFPVSPAGRSGATRGQERHVPAVHAEGIV